MSPNEGTPAGPARRPLLAPSRVATAVLLAAFGLWMAASPAARGFVATAGGLLARLDVAGLRDFLEPYGERAWIVTSGLMILQSLAAPIPAVPITLVNALLYGPWLGALISWGSAQAAAALCYVLARALGRPFVERIVSARALAKLDGFFARDGLVAVTVLRLVPFVSFDVVSYAGGLTSMRLVPFLIATGIGQLPATLVYSHAGAALATEPARSARLFLFFLGGMALLAAAIAWKVRARRRAEAARS